MFFPAPPKSRVLAKYSSTQKTEFSNVHTTSAEAFKNGKKQPNKTTFKYNKQPNHIHQVMHL
jgi:hypothetical protein